MKEKIPEYEQQEQKEGGVLEVFRKKAKELSIGAITLAFFASCKEQGKSDKVAEQIAQEKAAAISEQMEGERVPEEGVIEMPLHEVQKEIQEKELSEMRAASIDVENITKLVEKHKGDFAYRRGEHVLRWLSGSTEIVIDPDPDTIEVVFVDVANHYVVKIDLNSGIVRRYGYRGSDFSDYRSSIDTSSIKAVVDDILLEKSQKGK